MQDSGMGIWRATSVLASAIGFASVVWVWNGLDEAGTGYLLLCSVPLLIGLVAGMARMEAQHRILLLWLAAALSGLVAALTIFSGAGLTLLGVMLVYLLAAWKINEPQPCAAR